MPAKRNSRAKRKRAPLVGRYRCSIRPEPEPVLPPTVNRARASALVQSRYKWVNGTVLHYYFFDRPREHGEVVRVKNQDKWYTWVGAEPQRKVARKAFAHWKAVGVGLEFEEVDSADEAELRIGFMEDDGSWSYLGTYNLKFGPAERTMNFGWDITVPGPDGFDTALHEVGHALGMPHEHQNPFAGIVWDERAVYDAMAEPPNEWDDDTTYNNILRKIGRTQVRGSDWDPNSIMHYAFEPGLIKEPALYHRKGLFPAGGLSRADKAWARNFYPAIRKSDITLLEPGVSQPLAALSNSQQQNFLIKPPGTRVYEMRTFGTCDSVIVLFVRDGNTWRYQTADDDGGEDRNAALKLKLFSSKEYMLRVRLRYSDRSTPPSVMIW